MCVCVCVCVSESLSHAQNADKTHSAYQLQNQMPNITVTGCKKPRAIRLCLGKIYRLPGLVQARSDVRL